jgi:hypothetical protein
MIVQHRFVIEVGGETCGIIIRGRDDEGFFFIASNHAYMKHNNQAFKTPEAAERFFRTLPVAS